MSKYMSKIEDLKTSKFYLIYILIFVYIPIMFRLYVFLNIMGFVGWMTFVLEFRIRLPLYE